jgi:Ala-tRNA(Pro) deacylase
MAIVPWLHEFLVEHGLKFEERHHREVFTAQEVAEREHFSGARVAKVVVVMADGRPVELVLPANRRVVLEKVRRFLGAAEVRMATETEMDRFFPGCETGALPAGRYWPGVEVVADATLGVAGDVLIQGGTHRDAIRMRYSDWFDLVRPWVEAFSEPAEAPH